MSNSESNPKSNPRYPLEQLLEVKQDRVDKAEKVVKEKKRALEIEEEKLKKVHKERDDVANHHDEKLQQLRDALDQGTTSSEILQMKAYLKTVKESLAKEEIKVQKQKEQVAVAKKYLEEATEELRKKRVEMEKIKIHKDEWNAETIKEMLKAEGKESDELGNLMHQAEQRKRKSL